MYIAYKKINGYTISDNTDHQRFLYRRGVSAPTILVLAPHRPLLENGPWEPVGNGLSHRFSNRFPPTETNGLALGHRVFNPVP